MRVFSTEWRLVGLVVTLTSLVATPVLAQPRPTSTTDSAPGTTDPIALFDEGAVAFQRGAFEKAITLFERAYQIDPAPILLYNIARSHEGLDQPEEALSAYRQYLEKQPDAEDRGAVEARIEALDKEVRRRQELQIRREAPPPPPPVSESPSAAPWIIAGVGGAGLILGGILGGLSIAKEDDAEAAPVANDAASLIDEAQSLGTAATVTFIAAGAVVVAGVVWGAIDIATTGDDDLEVAAGLRGNTLAVWGTF